MSTSGFMTLCDVFPECIILILFLKKRILFFRKMCFLKN